MGMNLVMLGADYVPPLYLSADVTNPTSASGWISQGLTWAKDALGIVNAAQNKVTPPVVAATQPSFMDQYGTSVLIGGGALLVVAVLLSGKRKR
jgi:hypothetical protein